MVKPQTGAPDKRPVPVFRDDIDGFVNFLTPGSSASISPERFALVFGVDPQSLRVQDSTGRSTDVPSLDAEIIQSYLSASVHVVSAAAVIVGSIERAITWFTNEPLATFDNRTPHELVVEQRWESLVEYVESLRAGYVG
jgi:hypothetical protein